MEIKTKAENEALKPEMNRKITIQTSAAQAQAVRVSSNLENLEMSENLEVGLKGQGI